MSEYQVVALLCMGSVALLGVGVVVAHKRMKRTLKVEVATRPLSTRPEDIPLRDADYLLRQHLKGLPTSRRKQDELTEREWTTAFRLCKMAGLIDGAGRWHVEDWRTGFEALQRANKHYADTRHNPKWVDAYDDDW